MLKFNRDRGHDGPDYSLHVWLAGQKHGELTFIAFRLKQNESRMICPDIHIRYIAVVLIREDRYLLTLKYISDTSVEAVAVSFSAN